FFARDWPASSITFVKRVSPDLVDPYNEPPAPTNQIRSNGRVAFPTATRGVVFWPRTASVEGSEVIWEVELGGQQGMMQAPLLFLDNTAAHDPATVKAAEKHYHEQIAHRPHLRRAEHMGAERRYAPEDRPRAATFATRSWVLAARGRDAP